MIVGIGIDIVEIARITALIERHGRLFLERIFTEQELALSTGRKHSGQFFAGRWAAKEAAVKALGCGIGTHCGWLDLQITANHSGAPQLNIRPEVLDALGLPAGPCLHLSISHEQHYACATVIIEATTRI